MIIALLVSLAASLSGGLGLVLAELALFFGVNPESRLVRYVDTEYVAAIKIFGGTFIIHLFLSILMIYFYKHLVDRWNYNRILIPMYVYGSCLMFIFIDYGIIAGRIREMLCVPSSVVILPSFLLIFKPDQRIIPYAAIVGYCVIWFSAMISSNPEYQSIFQFFIKLVNEKNTLYC